MFVMCWQMCNTSNILNLKKVGKCNDIIEADTSKIFISGSEHPEN